MGNKLLFDCFCIQSVVLCYAEPENSYPTRNAHICCQEGWQDVGCYFLEKNQ